MSEIKQWLLKSKHNLGKQYLKTSKKTCKEMRERELFVFTSHLVPLCKRLAMQSWPLNQYYMQADSLALNHASTFGY